MANKKENAETAQNVAENAAQTVETIAEEVKTESVDTGKTPEEVEVPENAEEITQEQALEAAANEVNRLGEENTVLKQTIDEQNAKLDSVEKVVKDLETENAELKTRLEAAGGGAVDSQFYIELLNSFEGKIDEYAGLRRERLRKEFITDLKEEINKQREQLKNA